MKLPLYLLALYTVACCYSRTHDLADMDTIKQQIVGTWLSDAATNTCERSDKRKNPSSTSQIRVTYNADGTFIGYNIVKHDGKFERNAMFKGTYRIILADFDGVEVPALFTKTEEVENSTQCVKVDERTLERIVMDDPVPGHKVEKHMIVGFWRRAGSLNPCPRGEVTYSYWLREEKSETCSAGASPKTDSGK